MATESPRTQYYLTLGATTNSHSKTLRLQLPGRRKGWRKIKYCCEQAAKDNLEYSWVDTCCIDKSSSAELSESVNSMYAWYGKAVRCYVYLSDISTGTIAKARWFTRGWTLQELIAPKHVIFFSRDWNCIGTKYSLFRQLSAITRN